MNLVLNDVTETESLGAKLWQLLPNSSVVFLEGELGAGKTTLVRGVLRASGYRGAVKSPTFTLVEEYEILGRKILHFDLYRLTDPEELEWIGIRDYIAQPSLCFIEWAQLGQGVLPEPDLILKLTVHEQKRFAQLLLKSKNLEKTMQLQCKNNDILL